MYLPHVHFAPTWLDVAQFLDAFWPELGATFLGALLGFLSAVELDRRRNANEQQAREEADRQRLSEVASTLRESIVANYNGLVEIQDAMRSGNAMQWSGLELGTWQALSDDIVRLLPEPPLRAALAIWYRALEVVDALVTRHFEFALGVSSAMGNAPSVRDHTAQYLLNNVTKLATQVPDLSGGLAKYELPSSTDEVPQ